ncbi:hypothetical protein SISSUDRAFT_62185 [Sistotremastrum suecicum HHB10207 ss-3]|uniref:Uncharacterized protein n=1 Tax=Sistotremastrum suecicum HHB10207 ss-3 TaxID=1314776 RepID=A0A166BJX4_9AGAM|nr:hypothetical protein SISSUDRAFT_62185 [Sistotremastrum suecicum HHB10207 ss-3]
MSRVRPKNNTPDCVLLDHAPEDFVTIPSCDWTIRPHLTLRIIEFLRANPDASAWAYHLGTNLRRPVVTGATANLSKFVFEEDIEFKKYFREDREVFEQRVRKYLERCVLLIIFVGSSTNDLSFCL